jgi:hypothetical protein
MLAPFKGARRFQEDDATGKFEALGIKASRREVPVSHSVTVSLIGLMQKENEDG